MLIDPPQPIFQQNDNVASFPKPNSWGMEIPGNGGGGQLQRAMPPWMQGRQMLPPAQAPMYRPPQPQPFMGGGGWGGGGGGGWGGPPPWLQQRQQMWSPPQWAPPAMSGNWGLPEMATAGGMGSSMGVAPAQSGMGFGGGGWGGNQQGYMPPPTSYVPAQIPQQPAAPQWGNQQRNTGAPSPQQGSPQYNSQAFRPQPAGQVNQAAPAQPPPMAQNRQAAITPTPIFRNTQNDLA